MTNIGYDEQTNIHSFPALGVTKYTGLSDTVYPTNTGPDSGNVTELVIPFLLTAYSPPSRKPKMQTGAVIPIMNDSLSFGGTFPYEGATDIARVTMEGTIDTPCIDETISQQGTDMGGTQFRVPELKVEGHRMTFADYILMLWEGKAIVDFDLGLFKVEPIWFRDPYGRKFTSIKILDFTASYVEAVPGRTSFTMHLLVPGPVIT